MNLSYSSQGVTSGMISIGVADEVTRNSDPSEIADEPIPSSSAGVQGSKRHSEEASEHSEATQDPSKAEQVSCSSSSSSLSSSSSVCQATAVKTHTITTSSSSPAICDMETGSEGVTTGASSSHGARASELNIGPAIGKYWK